MSWMNHTGFIKILIKKTNYTNMIKRDAEIMFLIGDLHYGVHVNSLEWFEYQKQFMYDVMIPAFESYKQKGVKITVWQLGDIFEHKMSLNVNILNMVIDMFRDVLKYVDEFNVILGNHDTYYIDRNTVNSPSILASTFDNFNIYREPTELLINDKFKFLLLPWMKSTEKLHEEIAATDANYLLTHIDINEFKYPSGVKIRDNVDPKALEKFDMVYSGHIHLNQRQGNTRYIGTPYSLDLSDLGDVKGYYMLEFGDANFNEHFVPNMISPEYKRIKFHHLMEMSVTATAKLFKNSFMYIDTPSKLLNDFNITKASEFLRNVIPDLRKLKFEPYSETEGLDDKQEVQVIGSLDIFEIADELMKKDDINKEKREATLSLLNELHETAKSKMKYGEKS